jgi:hypothetical protein
MRRNGQGVGLPFVSKIKLDSLTPSATVEGQKEIAR